MGLENYVKLKKLGQGSFGSVYLARDQRDGKQYVMKEIDVSALGQKARKEALREISFLSRLNHPSIIAYREWFEQTVTEGGTSRNTLDIVMEYADGGDLSQIIKGRKGRMLPEDQIVEYLVQVALAIKHIHDRKIIHRDIKSENIFLHDKFVKLGDFGISKSLANTLAQARTRIGTPYYLSPEICMDKPYDQKNDMWALGVVLYELCTLKHPFDSNSMEGLLHAIIHTKHKAISSMYSKDLRDLVDCLLQKNPKKRFSIHQLLKLPFIESQIGNFLSKHKAEEEFSHTILHSLRTVPEVPDGNPPMGLLRDSNKSGAGGAGSANMESISEEGAGGVGITGNRGGGRADTDGDANSGASPRTGRKDGGKENVNPQANGAGKTSSSSSSSVSAVEDATTSLESKKKMQQQYDNLQALINRKDLSPQELIRQYRLAAADTKRQQKEMALKQNAALLRAVGGMDSMDGGHSGSGVGGAGTSAVPGSNGGSVPAGNAVASSSTSNSGSSSSSNNNSTASTNNVVNVPASPTKAANSTSSSSSSSSSSASSSSSSSATQAPVQTSRMTTEKSSNNVASAGATSSSSCSSSVTGPKYPPTTGPSISSSSSSVASSSSSSSSNEKTAHAAAALLSPQAHHALQQKQQQQLLLQQHQQQQQEKQLLLQQQQQQLLAQLQQQRERQQRQRMSQQGGGGNPYGPTYNGGHMFDNAKAGGTSNSNSNNNAYRPPHAMLNNGGGGLNTNGMNGHYMHNGGGGGSGVNSGHSRNGPSHFASPTSAACMPDMGRQGGGGGGSSRRDNGGGGGYGGHGGVQTRHGGPIPFNNMYDKPASLVPPSFPKLPTLGNIPGVNSGRYGNVQHTSAAAASSSSSHVGGGGGANPYAYVPHQMYQDAQKIQQKLLQQQQQQQQYQYEQQQQLLRHQQMMKQQHQRQHRGGGSSSNHMAHNLGPAHGAGQHRLAQQGHHHHGGGGGGGPAELYPSYAAYGQYPDPYGGGRPGMYIGGGHGGGGIAVGYGGGHGHGHHRQRQHGPNGIVAAAAREVGYETHVHHVGKASKGHKYHR